MPIVDSAHILFIASIIEILTQLLKGPIPDEYRQWIPGALTVVGLAVGAVFGLYYHTDLMAAVLEGLFGAALALGFYQVTSRVPAVNGAFGNKGWLADNNA